jgi:hypothetical protein
VWNARNIISNQEISGGATEVFSLALGNIIEVDLDFLNQISTLQTKVEVGDMEVEDALQPGFPKIQIHAHSMKGTTGGTVL